MKTVVPKRTRRHCIPLGHVQGGGGRNTKNEEVLPNDIFNGAVEFSDFVKS